MVGLVLASAVLWNNLPQSIKDSQSVETSKQKLKRHLVFGSHENRRLVQVAVLTFYEGSCRFWSQIVVVVRTVRVFLKKMLGYYAETEKSRRSNEVAVRRNYTLLQTMSMSEEKQSVKLLFFTIRTDPKPAINMFIFFSCSKLVYTEAYRYGSL